MGFRDYKLFCVAPIVIGTAPLQNYDFFAVGTDCCNGVASDFRCGDYNKPNARAGLRLMREEERAYYRLAVQQAEAAYNIRSAHPLFFEWLEDPLDETNAWQEAGFQHYMVASISHLSFNVFCIAMTVVIASQGAIDQAELV